MIHAFAVALIGSVVGVVVGFVGNGGPIIDAVVRKFREHSVNDVQEDSDQQRCKSTKNHSGSDCSEAIVINAVERDRDRRQPKEEAEHAPQTMPYGVAAPYLAGKRGVQEDSRDQQERHDLRHDNTGFFPQHKNSPSVGAVRTVRGPDVPRLTVGDTTDAVTVPFPIAGVGGLQDGAAVAPIAAASLPGGDEVSSPKQAASPPPSGDRASTDVKVLVLDKPGTASGFPGDRRVLTVEVRIFKKFGWFAKSRSTPYVTTVFRMHARTVVLVCAYTFGMWLGQLLWSVLAGLGWGQ